MSGDSVPLKGRALWYRQVDLAPPLLGRLARFYSSRWAAQASQFLASSLPPLHGSLKCCPQLWLDGVSSSAACYCAQLQAASRHPTAYAALQAKLDGYMQRSNLLRCPTASRFTPPCCPPHSSQVKLDGYIQQFLEGAYDLLMGQASRQSTGLPWLLPTCTPAWVCS